MMEATIDDSTRIWVKQYLQAHWTETEESVARAHSNLQQMVKDEWRVIVAEKKMERNAKGKKAPQLIPNAWEEEA